MTVLSETLCTLRKQKNIAQKDVAQALNISNASYNMYEKGKREPNIETLQRMAAYFDVTLDYLTTGRTGDLQKDLINNFSHEEKKKQELTARDERDIKKDLDSLREKLENKEYGPAAYDGQDIPDEDIDLFLGQVELMLRRLKVKNKEKYATNQSTPGPEPDQTPDVSKPDT